MYKRAYGIIETLAPLHVGASAGEETGNLNLIFRDQFTQTGIIPGSSIRGRFRADMRQNYFVWIAETLESRGIQIPEDLDENEDAPFTRYSWLENKAIELGLQVPKGIDEGYWYGHHVVAGVRDGGTTEALAKFEYASIVWLPVFCPGQPIVWITCPWLLKRYQQIANIPDPRPLPYTAAKTLQGRQVGTNRKVLFFNLGFLEVEHEADLTPWIPIGATLKPENLLVVGDNDMSMLHDMGLYRQSRVKLLDDMKKVDTDRGAFFNVEALPEASVLVFPIALKQLGWQPFGAATAQELYFGGLESIGFGRCRVTLAGEY